MVFATVKMLSLTRLLPVFPASVKNIFSRLEAD
jgi:hypothetical protein